MMTKSIFILIAFVCFAKVISAQTVNAGSWMIGGSAGFNSTTEKGSDTSNTFITFAPDIGYFIMKDLAIGARMAYVRTSSEGMSDSNLGFGPFARYYVSNPVYVQAGYDFETSPFDGDFYYAGGGSTFHASIGYSWFFNTNIAVEPSFFVAIYNGYENGPFQDFTQFGLNIGIQGFAGRDINK